MGSAGRFTLAVLLLCLVLASCEDTRSPVDQAANWWPPSQRAAARCVIGRESGGNPNVVGSEGERGVLQIHPVHRRAFERLTGKSYYGNVENPVLSGQFAYQVLYAERGWQPWRNTAGPCGLL